MSINLVDVETPIKDALDIISWYCKCNDCETCALKINDDTCITDKDPDVWWMYLNADRKTEPQTENPCDGCVCDDGKHLMYCMNCKGIAWKTEPPKVKDEPQTEYDKYREKIRLHDPHKDWSNIRGGGDD